MKIAIKKKYVMGVAAFISLLSGYTLLQEFIGYIIKNGLSSLIVPAIFTITSIYAIFYWLDIHSKGKLAKEIGKETYKRDSSVLAEDISNYLINKTLEEEYTLNISKNRVKYTSTWEKQKQYEELEGLPNVIKQELYERTNK